MDRAELYDVLDTYLGALGRRDPKAVRWAEKRSRPRTTSCSRPAAVWGHHQGGGSYGALRRSADRAWATSAVHKHYESAYTVRLKLNAAGAVAEAETIVVRQWIQGSSSRTRATRTSRS
jgi:hypothetical protein